MRQTYFCRDKSSVMTNMCLSWPNTSFCDKSMLVMTNVLLWKIMLLNYATNIFLSWQKFCHDKHVFVMTKHIFLWQEYACHDKSFVVKNYVCHEKIFLSQQIFLCDKHNFVVTKVLFWHAYFCHDKHGFVMTKHLFCLDKSMLVETKLLSQETCVWHDKYLSL